MNKNKSQLLLLAGVVAVGIAIAILFAFIPNMFSNFDSAKQKAERSKQDLEKVEAEFNKSESALLKEEDLLKNIKAIYQATPSASTDNLSMFGTQFDDVIQRIQQNGLMIRAIEYQMTPDFDPLSKAPDYNTCALKFFLVGSYGQMKTLLNELNTNFPYLLGISKVNILVYEDNTDYVLADFAVTLYSKKAKK
jgi:hypothetical protein